MQTFLKFTMLSLLISYIVFIMENVSPTYTKHTYKLRALCKTIATTHENNVVTIVLY